MAHDDRLDVKDQQIGRLLAIVDEVQRFIRLGASTRSVGKDFSIIKHGDAMVVTVVIPNAGHADGRLRLGPERKA